MRRILICTAAIVAVVAVPAQAKEKAAKAPKCTPKAVGYHAKGTLVEQALTQTAGADTEAKGDDRYSGTLTVDVTKANHKGLKGEQEFTLTNGRVNFYDAADDGTDDEPAAGDRVGLHGKVTKLRKKCDSTGFEPTVTLRKVAFKAPKS